MRWRRRAKGWNRSFGGRKNASQPERPVYLRTLSNLSNPSEVRGVLSMSRSAQVPKETALTASQVELAHRNRRISAEEAKVPGLSKEELAAKLSQ